MAFLISDLQTMEDPAWVVAQYRGEIDLASGGTYNNRYVGIFQIGDDGRIQLFREHFDPIVLQGAFGGAEALARTFNLEGS